MLDFLKRILSTYSDDRTDWLSAHQNAQLVGQRQHGDGWLCVYEDAQTSERAIYRTDDVGNIKSVDVIVQ